MRQLRSWLLRLAGVFGGGRADGDIAEELHAHRDFLTAEYVRAGMTPEDARRRAAAEFGSVTSVADAYRDRRGVPLVETGIRETRMAVRSLARTPVLSVSMILVLGLGIGLGTAIVAVFHAIVWADLPVPEPSAVIRITQRFEGEIDRRVQGQVSRFSYPELDTYRRSTRAFVAVAGLNQGNVTWRHDTGMRLLRAALVTGDYFAVLPVSPAVGRMLRPSDARQPVVVISHRLWTEAFDRAGDVVGRTMWLDRSPCTIVGVAPPEFSGTEVDAVNVWVPLEAAYSARGDETTLREQNLSWLQLFGRLAPGASLAAAHAEATLIAAQLDGDYPGRRTTIGLTRASRIDSGAVEQSRNGRALTSVALAAGGIVGLLFLICGSNAAVLLLARGAERQKEIALRVALGAGRIHIVRQLAAEVGVIAMTGAGFGVLVCFATLQGLAGFLPIGDLLLSIRPDVRVFAFAVAAAVVVALLFGLAPARQSLRVDCLANLKSEGSLFGRHVPALRLRRALIAVQITVSIVLVVAAALLGRSVSQAWMADTGYVTRGVFVVQPDANQEPGFRPADRGRLGALIAEDLSRLPGIRAVALATLAPFFGTGFSQAATTPAAPFEPVRFNQIDERYFAALEVPLVAGRSFVPREDHAVMVNAALARRFWGDAPSAIGQILFIPTRGGSEVRRRMQVIGVVPTLQTTSVGVADGPTYYTLLTEQDARTAFLIVRAEADAPVPRLVVSTVQAVDASAFVSVTSLDARMLERTTPARLGVFVAGFIGLLALGVAAVGIHGVIAFTVTCRTREIGVYQALGARPAQVLRLILGWTLRGVAIGSIGAFLVTAGLAAAFADEMRGMLNGLSPLDPFSFLLGLLILLFVIGVAAYLPARRALGLAPIAALHRN